MKINWRVFLACWSFSVERYGLDWRTPWFEVSLSTGRTEWYGYTVWFGLRVWWEHPKFWNVDEGQILFSRGDEFLSWQAKQTLYDRVMDSL